MAIKDSRDKVFSLLCMINEEAELLKPDYTLSEFAVFAKATFANIQKTKSLGILGYVEIGDRQRQRLVSWVVDFVQPKALYLTARYGKLNRFQHLDLGVRTDEDHCELTIEGVMLDIVTDALPVPTSPETLPVTFVAQILALLKRAAANTRSSSRQNESIPQAVVSVNDLHQQWQGKTPATVMERATAALTDDRINDNGQGFCSD